MNFDIRGILRPTRTHAEADQVNTFMQHVMSTMILAYSKYLYVLVFFQCECFSNFIV